MLSKKIISGCFALVCGLSGAVYAQQNDPALAFDYRFDQDSKIKTVGGAQLVDGVLRLDGKNGYAVVPDSKGMQLTDKGMTLVGVVKFNDDGDKGGTNNSHDMIFSKGREFIFGRTMNTMYVNLYDGEKFIAYTTGGKTKPGVWTHFTAVFERSGDSAQGDGWRTSIFIDGKLVARKSFKGINPQSGDSPLEIGRWRIGGTPWYLDGEIAEVAMYNRALTDGEVEKLFSRCGKVDAARNN